VLGAAATVADLLAGRSDLLGGGCGGASPRGVFGRQAGAVHASSDRVVAAAAAAAAADAPAAVAS